MSSEVTSADLGSTNKETASSLQAKDSLASENSTVYKCDMCKISVHSMKNFETHQAGKKHKKMICKKQMKTQKKKTISESTSNNNVCDSSQPECPMQSETNLDQPPRKKKYPQDYRDSYAHSTGRPDRYRSSNLRGRYSYNHRNYGNRNHEWGPLHPDQSNRPNWNYQNRRLPSSQYNVHGQNYSYYQQNYVEIAPFPRMYHQWNSTADPSNKEFSENIQPPGGNMNYKNHSNTNQRFEEVVKPTSIEQAPQKQPDKVTENSANKNVSDCPNVTAAISFAAEVSNEGVQKDSGGETQQEKGKVLSENMTGKRLAHWINPSSQKDRAEIGHFLTELSKSRKKQNLIKLKLQTDKASGNNLEHSVSEGPSAALDFTPLSPETPESENLPYRLEVAANRISNVSLASTSEPKKRQRSTSCTNLPSDSRLSIEGLKNSAESDKRMKKAPERSLKQTVLNNQNSESPSGRKRKDSAEKSGNSKRHRCRSTECFEECINTAVSESVFQHPAAPASVPTTPINATIAQDYSSQSQAVYVKKECEDILDVNLNNPSGLNLNELIQRQSGYSDDATISPVESLINLFATGNITIKKEFDDPLIDAIRSVDPALLNKVCENDGDQSSTNQEVVSKAVTPVLTSSSLPTNCAPSLTVSLKNILNELQNISTDEERVKENLQKADQQIQQYQTLLDEWKTKKIKFQSEEEILRNKRNTLVNTMNDLVMQQAVDTAEIRAIESPNPNDALCISAAVLHPSSPAVEVPSNNSHASNNTVFPSPKNVQAEISSESKSSVSNGRDSTISGHVVESSEDDEIAVLDIPENKIPVIDLDHSESSGKRNASNVHSKKSSRIDTILASAFKLKDLEAHDCVINSIQVFDGYLYTSSNDKTVKRFSLKDPSVSMTYIHAKKNITQMCVEKMCGKTYLFTSSSVCNEVTVFNVADGSKLQVFNFPSHIASMCRARAKVFVGLRSGSVAICDWKEQKELVHINEPIRNIVFAHQGGINLLVTLSTYGHVSIRDADRSGLLIRYVKALAHVPLFMALYNDCVYLSSAGYLSVLDLSNGTFVKKYALPAAYTSLTVYKDHIFTTSFSGFVRCYSKFDIKDVKAFYGAGRMALTCIHVQDGWVFTGNRAGLVSVFRFDSGISLPCQFEKCEMVFACLEDLMYHVMDGKDHVISSSRYQCPWRQCGIPMRKNWDTDARKDHIRQHISRLSSS